MPRKFNLIIVIFLMTIESLAGKIDQVVTDNYLKIEYSRGRYQQMMNSLTAVSLGMQASDKKCSETFQKLIIECHKKCEPSFFVKEKEKQLSCYRYFALIPKKLIPIEFDLKKFKQDVDSSALSEMPDYQKQLKEASQGIEQEIQTVQKLSQQLASKYQKNFKHLVQSQIGTGYLIAIIKGKLKATCEIMKNEIENLPNVLKQTTSIESPKFWYRLLFRIRFFNKEYPKYAQSCDGGSISDQAKNAISQLEVKAKNLNKILFLKECRNSIYEDFSGQKCESIKAMNIYILSLIQEKK